MLLIHLTRKNHRKAWSSDLFHIALLNCEMGKYSAAIPLFLEIPNAHMKLLKVKSAKAIAIIDNFAICLFDQPRFCKLQCF